jgi:glycosyltransferase involved in cell wall biosynthesis
LNRGLISDLNPRVDVRDNQAVGDLHRAEAPTAGTGEPVRVLFLHNRYRSEGGEERACSEIASLLERRGHPVSVIEQSSATLSKQRAARALLAGGLEPERIEKEVARCRADVVHVHNVHPAFGWRALTAARRAGARTVFHLHNFRLFCAIGVAYQNGAPCYRCHGRNTLPGVRLRCRGSLTESLVYAAGLHRQQPHLIGETDQFVALSETHGARLVSLGLPAETVTVLPNFIAESRMVGKSRADQGQYVLAMGRLVDEKGFDTAVRAARAGGVPLVIAGSGPDEPRLRELAGTADVTFAGRVPADELVRLLRGAAVILAPSRCEEACPYSVLDALASGVPVLASDRGGLRELVGEDSVVPVDDQTAWDAALGELWRSPGVRRELGERALANARRSRGEDAYYRRLLDVYEGPLVPAGRADASARRPVVQGVSGP